MTKKKLIAITGCVILLLSMMVGGVVYFRQAKDPSYEQAKNPVSKKPDDSKKNESKPDEVKPTDDKSEEQKPVEQPVSTKPTSKPSQPAPSKPASKPTQSKPEPSKPAKPQHTCTWTPIIKEVYHDAVGHYEQVLVKAAWTEERPIYGTKAVSVCNTCGQIIEGDPGDHAEEHMLKGENGSHRTEYIQIQTGTEKIEHPAEYKQEWVVDSKAWTEQVTIGYKCNGCGKTK